MPSVSPAFMASTIERDSFSPLETYSRVRMVDFRISTAAIRPCAVNFGDQALSYDESKHSAETSANGVLLAQRECADDALDGFGGVDGVEGGEHQDSGFSGFERGFDGFLVAHLADEDYFGSLAQRTTQCRGEARCIAVNLALMNAGALVRMQEFNRDLRW